MRAVSSPTAVCRARYAYSAEPLNATNPDEQTGGRSGLFRYAPRRHCARGRHWRDRECQPGIPSRCPIGGVEFAVALQVHIALHVAYRKQESDLRSDSQYTRPDEMSGAARRPVGNAGEDQLASVAIENDVPVLEREQSQFGEVRHPRAVAEDVFVISGDHVDAVGRFQVPQRLDVGASRIESAVDQISRDRDQVDAEFVRSLDDGARP
jgi:hypothetical protein